MKKKERMKMRKGIKFIVQNDLMKDETPYLKEALHRLFASDQFREYTLWCVKMEKRSKQHSS